MIKFLDDLMIPINLRLMDLQLLINVLNLLIFVLKHKVGGTSMKALISICLVLRTFFSSFALVMMSLAVE